MFTFFSLQYLRMSGKSMNFNDKKYQKSEFYKNKKITKIEDIDANKELLKKSLKRKSSKKNHMAQRIHLNTLLDIMIMMLLHHYV